MDLFSADLPESNDEAAGVAPPAGASHEPDSAVRSWPDAVDPANKVGETGPGARAGTSDQAAGLSALLLPELQRIAQSEGITGTAKMRKGQLIAAIEERRQGGGSQGVSSPGHEGGGFRAVATPDDQPSAQIKTSDNSVQRGAPAGAGADRTFEQDAMESQTSTEPGLGGTAVGGIGETSHGVDVGVGSAHAGGEAVAAANGSTMTGAPREETAQAGEGQRGDRRRRNPRRDEGDDPSRAARDGADLGREGGRDRDQQGNRDQQGGRDRDGGRDDDRDGSD